MSERSQGAHLHVIVLFLYMFLSVVQHCKKNPNVNGLYISYVASICVMSSVLMFITHCTSSDIKAI